MTFKADGDGTLMTLMHEQFFDEDARDRHQHGWTGALDKLENISPERQEFEMPHPGRTGISTGTN